MANITFRVHCFETLSASCLFRLYPDVITDINIRDTNCSFLVKLSTKIMPLDASSYWYIFSVTNISNMAVVKTCEATAILASLTEDSDVYMAMDLLKLRSI